MNLQLLRAIRQGKTEACDLLIAEDIGILDGTTPEGSTPLHLAVRFGLKCLVNKMLVQRPFLFTQQNQRGDTALHVAARAGHHGIVRSIINHVLQKDVEMGQDQVHDVLTTRNSDHNTPLHDAIMNHHPSVALALISEIQPKPHLLLLDNNSGESPLSIAIDVRLHEVVRAILKASPCSVLHRNNHNKTPVHTAVLRNDLGILKSVLQKYPQITKSQDKDGKSPLHYAAALGYLDMAQQLIKSDASLVYVADHKCQTPVHIAAQYGHVLVLKVLLECCPDSIEQLDIDQRNVLHVAAQNGMTNVVRNLMELPDIMDLINATDVGGNTPLHLAASDYHDNVVCVLVEDGRVDVCSTNIDDMTALDLAESQANQVRVHASINRNATSAAASSAKTSASLDNSKILADKRMGFQVHLTIRALREAIAKRGKHLEDVVDRRKYQATERPIQTERAREVASTLTLMATLVATVTFNAAFTLPGGFKGDGPNEGLAVLSRKMAFKAFIVTDAIALTSSLTAAVIIFWSLSRPEFESLLITLSIAKSLTFIALMSMGLAFVTGLYAVLTEARWLAILICVIGCIFPVVLNALPKLYEWGAKQPRSDITNNRFRKYALLVRDILEGNLGYR